MLISIIIPAYNAQKYIKNALDSIFVQNFHDLEVIVVNDGSSDSTNLILEEYDVKVINQNNMGAAVARNNGLINASGDYILFMDADDTLKPNSLNTMTKMLDENVDVLVGLYSMFNIDSNKVIFEKDSLLTASMINNSSIDRNIELLCKYRLSSSPWRYFIKRSLLMENKLFFNENSLVEDAIWVPKLLCSANKILLNDTPFYNYNIHNNSVSTSKKFKFYEDAMLGCNDLYEFSKKLDSNRKKLVHIYYLMLIVGVMQDYDYLNRLEKNKIDNWFKDKKYEIMDCMNAIKILKIGSIIGNKNILLVLGRYLKRKNRVI